MKLSHFFIDRPIFAAVLSAFITIGGAIALFKLPISEYPEVVPPSVVVRAHLPRREPEGRRRHGRGAAGAADRRRRGHALHVLDRHDGRLARSTVTFKHGADIDRAQVQVQNRVSQALPRLPEEVRDLGVTTVKSSPNLTMVVHLTSPDGRYDCSVPAQLRDV